MIWKMLCSHYLIPLNVHMFLYACASCVLVAFIVCLHFVFGPGIVLCYLVSLAKFHISLSSVQENPVLSSMVYTHHLSRNSQFLFHLVAMVVYLKTVKEMVQYFSKSYPLEVLDGSSQIQASSHVKC